MLDETTAMAPVRQFALHIAEREIVHPEIFISWCFDRQLYADMTRESYSTEYIVLFSLTRENGRGTVEQRLVVRDADQLGSFIRFGTPATYTVDALLIAVPKGKAGGSGDSWFSHVQRKFLERYYGGYDISFPKTEEQMERFAQSLGMYAKVVAQATVDVMIPQGIFAKPPPPALKAWITAYSPRKLDDQCDLRGRAIYAFTAQLAHYPLWEGLKRVFALLLGLFYLYLGKEGEKVVLAALKPELVFTWPSHIVRSVHYDDLRPAFNYLPGFLLHPMLLTVMGLYGLGWYGFVTLPNKSSLFILAVIVVATISAILLAIAAVVIAVFVTAGIKLLRQRSSKAPKKPKPQKPRREETPAYELEVERAKLRAQRILEGRMEPIAVCAPGTDEVARKRQLLRQAPIALKVAAFKRAVCKPFVEAG
jgi:hypothetical protein